VVVETQTKLKLQFWAGAAFAFAVWSSVLWLLNITTPIVWTLALGFFALIIIQRLSSLPKFIAALVSVGLAAGIFTNPGLARETSLSITLLVVLLFGCTISGALVIGILRRVKLLAS
jgi:hypothetical protein